MNVFAYKITFSDPDTDKVTEVKGITFGVDYAEATKKLQLFYGADNIFQIESFSIADEDPVVIEESTFKFYFSDL